MQAFPLLYAHGWIRVLAIRESRILCDWSVGSSASLCMLFVLDRFIKLRAKAWLGRS